MKKKFVLMVLLVAGIFVFGSYLAKAGITGESEKGNTMKKENQGLHMATFAGGCFWCVESDFEKVDGVVEVVSGYTGGHKDNPTYEEVSSGNTGHVESVQVLYDPDKVSYDALLDVFWRHVDPTDSGGQFVDRGSQYTSVIYYHNDEQKEMAEESRKALEKSGRFKKPIVTEIRPLGTFYRAEEYHQDYHKTHKLRYRFYRHSSGRDQFLQKVWGDEKTGSRAPSKGAAFAKPGEEELRKRLTHL